MTWSVGTNRNSASLSTNFLISQGQATRSTLTCSRVIHFLACFSSFCVACLLLARLARELRIQGLVDKPPPFQSDPVVGTDQADTLADDIQARCRWLQHDVLHGVSFIHHAGDPLQDRIMQVILA